MFMCLTVGPRRSQSDLKISLFFRELTLATAQQTSWSDVEMESDAPFKPFEENEVTSSCQ